MTGREVVEIARDVFVMTSEKFATTSTMVRRGASVMLVDPAWTVTELNDIVGWVAARGLRVTAGFCTHAHHDHMLWHPQFGDAPRWASATSVAKAHEWHAELTAMLDDDYPPEWPNPLDGICALGSATIPSPFGDDQLAESIELVVHDGHSPGHTALLLAERGVILAGDMLSDIELPLPFSPDDLPSYLAALDLLAPAVSKAAVLVPGHGRVASKPMERLDADRRYLDDVMNGRDANDPRRGLPGMSEAHTKILSMASALRDG